MGWATTLAWSCRSTTRSGPCRAASRLLSRYPAEQFPVDTTITVVDNGSTDDTLRVAGELASRTPGLRVLHLDAKGRGLALRTAWLRSEADVVAYMDVDLSTRPGQDLAQVLLGRAAKDPDSAGAWSEKPYGQVQEGGLPGAVRSHECGDPARR
jgi:cellulose synthase/poly-beta-1,6-N-acetylglucosamine synthase-like glycosyltransferase